MTASNFGGVYVRNPKIKVEPLVRNLLYSNFRGSTATKTGLLEEKSSIRDYIAHMKDNGHDYTVIQTGLTIHPTLNHLAASPDGIIMKDKERVGLLEIKQVKIKNTIHCEYNRFDVTE